MEKTTHRMLKYVEKTFKFEVSLSADRQGKKSGEGERFNNY